MKLDRGIIDELRNFFLEHKLTIAVAESATAGNIQAAFSLAQNAGMFFHGGIVAYNLGQKARHLGVDPIHAETCNCVSEKVAGKMAEKVAELFLADFGVGITGFANTVPEQNINDLYAYISVAGPNRKTVTKRIDADAESDVRDVQLFYVNQTLALLKQELITGVKKTS